MNDKIKNILEMSSEERYLYFLRKVADFEELWGLFNDGWAVLGDDENQELLPFWPEKEFAQLLAKGSWKNYSPKSIKIDEFIERWLPGMSNDKKKAAVFYTPDGKGVVVEPLKLKREIEEELEQYE